MENTLKKLLTVIGLTVSMSAIAAPVDFATFVLTSPTLATPAGTEYLPLALTGPATDKLSLTSLSQWQWAQMTGAVSVSSSGYTSFSAGSTGTGSVVLATNPVLVTPNLGTPSAVVLTNATGVASGLTAGTVLANANLTGPITSVGNATSVAAQTGTGSKFVMDTNPVLVGPILGVASATSVNKVAFTAPATGSTLTIADGKTLTASNSLTLAGTDATAMTFPTTSATIARTDAGQTFTGTQVFSSLITGSVSGNAATVTTNANLTGPITSVGNATSVASQTGTGSTFVMNISPTLVTPNIGAATGTSLNLGIGALTAGVITGTGEILDGISTKTAAYSVTTSDRTILADATAGSFAITLPSAIGVTGFIVTIKKIDSTIGVVTIQTALSQTIDGNATQTLNSQYGSITVQSNGSNWFILN